MNKPIDTMLLRTQEELMAWLRLTLEAGVGSATIKTLLAHFGLPHTVYAASYSSLKPYVGEKIALAMKSDMSEETEAFIEKTLAWVTQPNHYIITLADEYYPPALLDMHDPPALLYVDGQLESLQKPALSIVGSRSATLGGMQNSKAFAKYLAHQGWCIVSGLAVGIDAAAHEGALESSEPCSTIAVMGTGINRLYPAQHKALALRIKENGALISEYPLDTKAQAFHFPRRNRIVAGLSRGILVVEAAKQSGSLITAKLAAEAGKEVFAIPGSIHSLLSRGCHGLIRQGAKLVETGQDILEELGYVSNPPAVSRPSTSNNEVPKRFKIILDKIGFEPMLIETISQSLSIHIHELSARLLQMELQGYIVRLSDGRYQQVAR